MSLISESILSILIASIIILLYIFIKRKLDYFKKQGLPYVKPTFISVLKSLGSSAINDMLEDVYKIKKDGDSSLIGFFHTFLTPAVLVIDPALVESVLIKDFSHFHSHGFFDIDFKREPLFGHLFAMKGDEWRTLRNKLLPTFTSGKLKGMIPTMEICAKNLIDEMKKNEIYKDVNIKELFKNYSIAIIADCIFTLDASSVTDPNSDLGKIANLLFKPSLFMKLKIIFIIALPKLAKLFRVKFIPIEHEKFIINLTRDTLDQRKRSGIKRNDFVQLLLELREKGTVQVDHRDLEDDEKDRIKQIAETESSNTKLEMTDELLAAQVFSFIGTYDNLAYSVAITLYLLSKNKDVQEKVRQEINDIVNKHGEINYSSLKEMQLLEATINEALRVYPPLIALTRECNKTLYLSDGQRIEKGTNVMIPARSLQNDSRYWQNPEQFNPDRFVNDGIVPGTYLPFGEGPRLCIAQRLALLMSKVMLAGVLMNFEVLHSKKNIEPFRYKANFSSEVVGGIWGIFKPLEK